MKDIIDKLSSYNIFNHLFPGILFVVIANNTTHFHFIQSNIVLGIFVYYFVGLIISRVGSLVIEPFLTKIRLIKYREYKDFVTAQKQDDRINLLLEVNNMYRTLCSMGFLLALLKLYDYCSIRFKICSTVSQIVSLVLILALFLFSYRKQTNYIVKRIDIVNHNNKK